MSDTPERPERNKVYHLRNQTYTTKGYTYVWAFSPEDAMEQIDLGEGMVVVDNGGIGFENRKPTSRKDLYEWDMKKNIHLKVPNA
jgi:hypothetical protein